MYPAAEFRRVGFRAVRYGLFTLLTAVGTVMMFAVTALHLSDPWQRNDPARGIVLVWCTVAAAVMTLVFELLWRSSRHPFTRCPHCRKPLTNYVPVVTASGCCYHCGERVLLPPADPPADELIPRSDFLTADTAYQRKAGPVILGGVLATYLGGFAALIVVNRAPLPEPLSAVVFVVLAAVAPVSAVAVLRWMAAGGRRNPALACPCCGKLLAGGRMLVAATRNCHQCGGRAILPRTRPLAPPHLGPMWTVARMSSVVAARRRRFWPGWVLTAAVVTAVGGLLLLLYLLIDLLQPVNWLTWYRLRMVKEFGAWVLIVGGLVGIGLAWRWILRSARRRHPLDCPRCGRDVLPPLARATKCCHQCGWQVVEIVGVHASV